MRNRTAKNSAPALALNDGEQMRLGDIIGAFRKDYAGMTDVFWLCCRAAPQNANLTHDVSVDFFGIAQKPNDMGLPPALWWRRAVSGVDPTAGLTGCWCRSPILAMTSLSTE